MRVHRTSMRLSAALLALALGATACGGGDDGDDEGSSSEGNASAIIKVNGTEPQNGLLPANTNETGGGRILQQLFTGLVSYDNEGKAVNEVAESIETDDSKTFTVTLKDGWKFTNGEAITAKTFVDTWNFGALSTNKQLNASFFEPIAGYEDVHPADPTPDNEEDPLPAPKAQALSGLKVVDDKTFTITLTAPASTFPQRLGYSAFSPLPSAALKDPKGFGENPVGNGPYMMDGPWEHKVRIKTKVNPDYQGTKKPKNGGIENVFYADDAAAYADLQADKVDVLDQLPDAALETFQDDLGDRAVNQEAGIFQSFSFPLYDKKFQGPNAGKVRQAISMAIDRETITKQIFNGTRSPAKDYSSPVVDGYDESICGDLCTYQPEEAKKLYEESGGIPGNKMTIAYNADAAHQAWVEAVCNGLKNTLGIDCTGKPYPLFADLRGDVTAKKMDSAFRTGWQMDYPALDNFLTPLYSTEASSNDSVYSNPAFDKLLDEGNTASSTEEGIAKFQEAEKLLVQDMPAIPLWYSNVTGGYATTVDNVAFDIFGVPVYTDITKA
jgi:oligopeptide transport system substrate-binding protein